jgi:hypothetical protein
MEEQEQEQEPTIEEIKIIANQKRPKKPSAYNDFIKQQMELLKGQNINPKEKMKLATQEWHKHKEPERKIENIQQPLPPPKQLIRKQRQVKEPIKEQIKEELTKPEEKPNINYDELHNDINFLKEMLKNQNNLIHETLKPKPRARPKPRPKPKKIIKTLDLTITDNEINKIINDEKEQEPKQDEKMKAFLDGLLKKN